MAQIPYSKPKFHYHDAYIESFDFGERHELNLKLYCNKEFNGTNKDGVVLLSFRGVKNIEPTKQFMNSYFCNAKEPIGMRIDFINYFGRNRYAIKFDYTDELEIICKGVTETEIS